MKWAVERDGTERGGGENGQCRERDGNRQAERAEVRDVEDRER